MRNDGDTGGHGDEWTDLRNVLEIEFAGLGVPVGLCVKVERKPKAEIKSNNRKGHRLVAECLLAHTISNIAAN